MIKIMTSKVIEGQIMALLCSKSISNKPFYES